MFLLVLLHVSRATIGVDFALKVISNWDNETTVRLQLWDIAGQAGLEPIPIRTAILLPSHQKGLDRGFSYNNVEWG